MDTSALSLAFVASALTAVFVHGLQYLRARYRGEHRISLQTMAAHCAASAQESIRAKDAAEQARAHAVSANGHAARAALLAGDLSSQWQGMRPDIEAAVDDAGQALVMARAALRVVTRTSGASTDGNAWETAEDERATFVDPPLGFAAPPVRPEPSPPSGVARKTVLPGPPQWQGPATPTRLAARLPPAVPSDEPPSGSKPPLFV